MSKPKKYVHNCTILIPLYAVMSVLCPEKGPSNTDIPSGKLIPIKSKQCIA